MGITLIRHAGVRIQENSALLRPGTWAGFMAGIAVILGNPKAILFYMGILPGFFDLGALTGLDIAVICAISAAMCLPVSWLGSLAPVTRAYGRARTGLKRITGDVFEGYGVKLALER
jgi:threonine/homoserine/homoserine lactone efflux protein